MCSGVAAVYLHNVLSHGTDISFPSNRKYNCELDLKDICKGVLCTC